MLYADPNWLVGLVDGGIVAVGPRAEVELELDAPLDVLRQIGELLCAGADPMRLSELAECSREEARTLLTRLAEAGVLAAEPAASQVGERRGASVARAIVGANGESALPRWVSTADELLVLPEDVAPAKARRALRAFIAGMSPHARLRAYAFAASRKAETAWGDRPAADALEAGLERSAGLDPDHLHLLDLHGEGAWQVPVERLEGLGAARAHRLGILVEVAEDGHLSIPDLGLTAVAARVAVPNLHAPGDGPTIASGIAPTVEEADVMARAEAAERYAAGELARRPLVRATERELNGAVADDVFVRFNDRQRASGHPVYGPEVPYLWTPAWSSDGSLRWVVGDAVFYPFYDPERAGPLPPTSSSGVAAHTDFGEARRRALAELVERDAFMWTWVQRVSREQIDPRTIPEPLARRVVVVEQLGWRVSFVNLTLETAPVVLCLLTRQGRLELGCACHLDASTAAAKAFGEAARALAAGRLPGADIEPEAVRSPEDHLQLHQAEDRRADHGFLFSSDERVELGEITGAAAPLEEAVRAVGEPLFIDLSLPATCPFVVARALVPGLVPISFGWDQEPLGMARLAHPVETWDGRRLGQSLDLRDRGPMLPHPFP